MIVIYKTLLSSKLSLITYIMLSLSIISLWFNKKFIIFGGLLLIASICGIIAHILTWQGILFIILFAYITFLTFNAKSIYIKIISGITVFLCSIMISPLHMILGFNNWLIANQIIISPTSVPYTMFLNFDKPLIGLFILGFSNNYLPLLTNKKAFIKTLKQSMPINIFGILLLFYLSHIFGYIKFDLKFDSFFVIWAINNLLFTCITEEALFRGLIQKSINFALKNYNFGKYIAIFIGSILFGLTMHYQGGLIYIILSSIAGLIYGYIYHITNKIEASILSHFLLNTCHFILFTYPTVANN